MRSRDTCFRFGSFDLRPATCELRATTCDLRPATCELRLATCELRTTTYELPVTSCLPRLSPKSSDFSDGFLPQLVLVLIAVAIAAVSFAAVGREGVHPRAASHRATLRLAASLAARRRLPPPWSDCAEPFGAMLCTWPIHGGCYVWTPRLRFDGLLAAHGDGRREHSGGTGPAALFSWNRSSLAGS